MKAWLLLELTVLSSFSCIEPAYQRCIQSGHCLEAEIDSGVDAGIDAGIDIVTGLIGHWKFDETLPGTVVDSSGQGHQGTVVGDARIVLGKLGFARDFDGGAGVKIDSTAQITNMQLISIAVWLRVRTFPVFAISGSAQPRIIDKKSFELVVCSDETCVRSFKYGNALTNGFLYWRPASELFEAPTSSLPNGRWRHIAVVHDRRRVENEPALYVDGAPVKIEKVDRFGDGTFISDQDWPLSFAYRASGSRFLDGQLDDVRLYNRLLNASEVEAIFRLAQ
jgi:hypothetical protein